MTDIQKKIRAWFRRHRWHTNNTPTGLGAYIKTPVQKGINYVSSLYYKDGTPVPEEKRLYWHNEYVAGIEIDRFNQDYLSVEIYKREKYTAGPDYERRTQDWPRQPVAYIKLTRDEVHKIAELMDICAAEAKEIRSRKK